MITETAFISVKPGMEDGFLAALHCDGIAVLEEAAGFLGIEIKRGIERPSVFQLTLRWQRLEDHTETFRGGPLFTRWREVISPFFAELPNVEHWVAVDET